MKAILKKLILAGVLAGGLVVGFSGAAFAEGKHHDDFGGAEMFKQMDEMNEQQRLEFLETKLDERLAKMTKNMDLTKDQQVKVRQVMADAQTQMLDIYEQSKKSGDKDTARGEAQAVLKQARQDIGDLLTDQQKAKMKEQRRKQQSRGKAKMLDNLDEKLELSDAQRVKVKTILDASHKELKAMRSKPGDEASKRAAGRTIMTAAADDIDKVLTKAQKAKFAQLRERLEKRGEGPSPKTRKKRGAF